MPQDIRYSMLARQEQGILSAVFQALSEESSASFALRAFVNGDIEAREYRILREQAQRAANKAIEAITNYFENARYEIRGPAPEAEEPF